MPRLGRPEPYAIESAPRNFHIFNCELQQRPDFVLSDPKARHLDHRGSGMSRGTGRYAIGAPRAAGAASWSLFGRAWSTSLGREQDPEPRLPGMRLTAPWAAHTSNGCYRRVGWVCATARNVLLCFWAPSGRILRPPRLAARGPGSTRHVGYLRCSKSVTPNIASRNHPPGRPFRPSDIFYTGRSSRFSLVDCSAGYVGTILDG